MAEPSPQYNPTPVDQYPPQGYAPNQQYPPPQQGYPPQGYPPQGYPPQGPPPQGYPPQQYPQQGYPPQGYQGGYAAPPPQQGPIVINMTNSQQQQAIGGSTVMHTIVPRYNTSTALWGSIGLSCCLQIHGFHYCYTGSVGLGLLSFFTYGGCWIWTLIDWCRMDDIVSEANARDGQITTVVTS